MTNQHPRKNSPNNLQREGDEYRGISVRISYISGKMKSMKEMKSNCDWSYFGGKIIVGFIAIENVVEKN